MRRRRLLSLGLGAAAVLAVAGGSLALLGASPRPGGKLAETGRALFAALAGAVLDGLLPADPVLSRAALAAQVERVEATIAGMPLALQAEVDELLAVATSLPGRRLLVGLDAPWAEAAPDALRAALAAMRDSSLALRQQAFHALRDLTNAAWFAEPANWAAVGYPGPQPV